MQVFISHAKQDGHLAKRLRTELARAGLASWSDEEIYPGDNWAKVMGQALEQSDVMLALVTRDALEAGPLSRDVPFALTSKSYGGRVIPILVGMTTFSSQEVPWILLRLNPIYLESADSDLHEVIERVRSQAEMTSNAAT